jgi:hypothetical protein
VKLLIATPVIASPFVFPKLAPVLVPLGVAVLVVLLLAGPKKSRKWKFKTRHKRQSFLNSGTTETADLDPANPFGMYDDYYD